MIVCPNEDCKRITLWVEQHILLGQKEQVWRLLPPAQMKVLPRYIPKAIVQDYEEACQIIEASPKASAALTRRCLQGMIRDFWGIVKPRLIDEVKALEGKVDPSTWQAIDGVREIGNIGAHMEKDVNLIIDVDPDEARALKSLIEILVDDWYVARHDREERLKGISEIAQQKKAQRSKTGQSTGPTDSS